MLKYIITLNRCCGESMIKNQILILLSFLTTFTFGLGEKTIFGQRISSHFGSNLINKKLILRPMPKWTLQNGVSAYNFDYSESEDSMTPLWKQTGIYSLEFVGAGISTTICAVMATISIMDEGDVAYWHSERWPFVYTGANLLITSSCTWGIGKLLGQKGAWWKTAVGAGVGGIVGSVIIMIDEKDRKSNDILWVIALSSTALGAVVGFNF
jgi:hypothetical protein